MGHKTADYAYFGFIKSWKFDRWVYLFNTFWLIWEVWAEKRPHEWLGGVLGVLGLAPSARNSQINQKVLKGYNKKQMCSALAPLVFFEIFIL